MAERQSGFGGTHRALVRRYVWDVTGGVCASCGMATRLDGGPKDSDRAELGHVLPDAMGGRLADGAVIQCRTCNSDLADTDLSPFLPFLAYMPVVAPSLTVLKRTYPRAVADADDVAARRAARYARMGL